jgi:hypothetical protein
MPRTCHRPTSDRLADACRSAMGACHPDHRAARAAMTRSLVGALSMRGCAPRPAGPDPVLDAHTRRAMGRWHPNTAATARALRVYAIGQPDPDTLEAPTGGCATSTTRRAAPSTSAARSGTTRAGSSTSSRSSSGNVRLRFVRAVTSSPWVTPPGTPALGATCRFATGPAPPTRAGSPAADRGTAAPRPRP